MSDVPMIEYLVWSNCPNNCAFCWQKKINDPTTILTEQEKLQALDLCISEISKLGYTDVLVIGGEILCPHSEEVNNKLRYLFNYMAERVRAEETRFFYVNTNLLYDDRTNLDALLDAFEGLESRLKFTTSCDPYGRFRTEESEMLFVRNLEYLHYSYPQVNVVMNMIITHQFFMQYKIGKVDGGMCMETMEPFGVKYVNLLPYIPVENDRTMDVTKGQILTVLEKAEAESPGYLANYVRDYDVNQNRILYEYHKDRGFIEATAETLPCGHNKNFSKVTGDGECYVCMLKEYLANRDHRFENRKGMCLHDPGRRGDGVLIPIFIDDDIIDGCVDEDWDPFAIDNPE